ncbi:MAG: hypothetical protein LBP63_02485 [Prevotellaceae bacterium]|jgi:hypothetical protein|nr:hypothetical protein [Prevotellaceae bacterium]
MKLRLLFALLIFSLPAYAQDDNNQKIRLGFQADFMRPAYPSYLNGRRVHKHEGNVIYTHKTNGATITCDSAYHYFPSDTIEFFGNVTVRHATTVMYSEKIFYDGIYAKVRGRLVKMDDTERNATLKTQFVDYNIDLNIGTYVQGGTLVRRRDTIESINGIFEGNTGMFTFINDVAMKNDSLVLACDTMLYDTHSDITTFKGNTKTWNGNNIMLSNFGIYKPNENEMSFSSNVYMQSETQEVWADSIWLDNSTKNAELFRNIQMLDTVQQIIIFGDKAQIADNYQTVFVTKNPAALYYTIPTESNRLSDTTCLIADTISTFMDNIKIVVDTIMQKDTTLQNGIKSDLLNNIASANDSAVNVNTETAEHDNIGKNKIHLDIKKNKPIDNDIANIAKTEQDSLVQILVTRDTAVRNTFAYHNVKIYKSDFQALCDSLVYHSVDSTTYMYHLPILWNDSTQITSGVATIYSKNRQIDYADFASPAMIIMREDSVNFSQLKGKSMKAFFKNNQMDRINVSGNGQSVYYIREKPEQPISAVEISECANIVIDMMQINGKSKINKVTYLMKPSSNTYPVSKMPEDSKQLKGFVLHDDIRPKSKKELFDGYVHKSQRQIVQAIEKPTFSITLRINRLAEK